MSGTRPNLLEERYRDIRGYIENEPDKINYRVKALLWSDKYGTMSSATLISLPSWSTITISNNKLVYKSKPG